MNTKTLKQLHENLKHYGQNLPNIINALGFIETVEQIVTHKDPTSIPILLKQFRDEEQYTWIFEAAKIAIEREYASDYVETIITNIHILAENAPEWACNFLFEILRTPTSVEQLQISMHLADQKALFKILNKVEKRLAQYKDLVSEIRWKLTTEISREVANA